MIYFLMRQLSTFISVQLCYLKVTMYISAYSQAFAKLNLSWMAVAIIRLYLPPLHKEFCIRHGKMFKFQSQNALIFTLLSISLWQKRMFTNLQLTWI